MGVPWTDSPERPPIYKRRTTLSTYVRMSDGVRLAVDVTLPLGHRTPLPAILRQTRYHRRLALSPPFHDGPLRSLVDQQYGARNYFVSRGYAWVDVCVRGSGASGGERPTPWASGERSDGAELLTWIAEQAWSNGRVGARGISYDGTAAEFLLWHGHPALRAVAPRFSLFDVYDDIAMPGGIHLDQFTRNWRRFNDALDRNRFDEAMELVFALSLEGRRQLAESAYRGRLDGVAAGALERPAAVMALLNRFVHGVAPTHDARAHDTLQEHVEARVPALDVHEAGRRMTFRDDTGLSDANPQLTTDSFSPHAHLADLPGGVPVFHYSGWYDGAYQRAAIKRWHALDDPGQRMIIGPWEHGGRQDISPWAKRREPEFDHEAELMRFFDAHLLDDEPAYHRWADGPRVKYFTIGRELWQTSDVWPPEHISTERLYLRRDGSLGERDTAARTLRFEENATGGPASRWRSLLPILSLTHYSPPRSSGTSFETRRVSRTCEITGHPIVHVEATFDFPDPRLFAYLEDVAPDGTVHHVTEGQLRGLHGLSSEAPKSHQNIPYRTYLRRDAQPTDPGQSVIFEFDLLPVSYLLRAGHALRLRFESNDVENFEQGPTGTAEFDLGNAWLDLPVASGSIPI